MLPSLESGQREEAPAAASSGAAAASAAVELVTLVRDAPLPVLVDEDEDEDDEWGVDGELAPAAVEEAGAAADAGHAGSKSEAQGLAEQASRSAEVVGEDEDMDDDGCELAHAVVNVVRSLAAESPAGVHFDRIRAALSAFSIAEIARAVCDLEDDCLLFRTITKRHFLAL